MNLDASSLSSFFAVTRWVLVEDESGPEALTLSALAVVVITSWDPAEADMILVADAMDASGFGSKGRIFARCFLLLFAILDLVASFATRDD